jgi:hypothetical protein
VPTLPALASLKYVLVDTSTSTACDDPPNRESGHVEDQFALFRHKPSALGEMYRLPTDKRAHPIQVRLSMASSTSIATRLHHRSLHCANASGFLRRSASEKGSGRPASSAFKPALGTTSANLAGKASIRRTADRRIFRSIQPQPSRE